MLDGLRGERLRVIVIALYALAMMLVGFAHRPMRDVAASADVLAAYVLPDGTVQELCTHDGGARPDPASDHTNRVPCDACLLTTAPGLAPVIGTAFAVLPESTQPPLIVAAVPNAKLAIYRALSRGPPAEVIG